MAVYSTILFQLWRSRCHDLSDEEKFEQLMEAFTAVGKGGPMRELVTKLIDAGRVNQNGRHEAHWYGLEALMTSVDDVHLNLTCSTHA